MWPPGKNHSDHPFNDCVSLPGHEVADYHPQIDSSSLIIAGGLAASLKAGEGVSCMAKGMGMSDTWQRRERSHHK